MDREHLAVLARAAQRGDREALGEILAAVYGEVSAQVRAKVPANDAPDVIQDALLTVLEEFPSLRWPGSFKAWVRSVVRGEIARYHRCSHLRTRPTMVLPLAAEDAQAALDRAEDRALIQGLLAHVPPRQQAAITLRAVDGLTFDQLADRLGSTRHAAEDLYWRACSNMGTRARVFPPELPLC
jgi:RNA polymerase sigma factor (sigma-70 family)